MYIRQTTKQVKGKTYVNHLLVEAIATPDGPRQRTICSLGNLGPRPRGEWLKLAHKIESALVGQGDFIDEPDAEVQTIVAKVRARENRVDAETLDRDARKTSTSDDEHLVRIHTDRVSIEEAREAGTVHVGWQFYHRLGLDEILADAGLDDKARRLSAAMILNRLIAPRSEHAMPEWIRSTALADILGENFDDLDAFPLYRNLDKLYPERARIEAALVERERELFDLDTTIYLYDLTSTYFEGQALGNRKAKRGYSRDKRPDCKQVVVGLVVNRDGFPIAHEVWAGNTQDRSTLDAMLDALAKRVDLEPGQTVVVDRGMAFKENLESIRARGLRYIVAARQGERDEHLAEFEDLEGFDDVVRQPGPRNPGQKKSRVRVQQRRVGEETHVLCLSDGRQAKDRAIREKHERRLLADMEKLKTRVGQGRLKDVEKIHAAIGRLRERHPRVARYYPIAYDEEKRLVEYHRDDAKMAVAETLDGSYLLKTDRHDLTADEAWRVYTLLTRAENAFRSMKSPLAERPIFHHLEHRVETHIFLCVLAYHLLVSIETTLLDNGVHTSWATVREQLRTHQICTVVLPAEGGQTLRIRQATKAEKPHRDLYRQLSIPSQIIRPKRTWITEGSDE